MFAALVLALVVDPQAGAAARVEDSERPAGELRVVLAAPVYQPDGAVSVETTTERAAGRSFCFTAVTLERGETEVAAR